MAFTYRVHRLNISCDNFSLSILLETTDGIEDYAIVFLKSDSFQKFYSLITYYQTLSDIIRLVFVETDLRVRPAGHKEQVALLSEVYREL